MKDQNLQRFLDSCRQAQPYSAAAAKQFFEGVVCFPVEQELLLQAFLYLNVRTYFPACQEMLLFEAAPNLNGHTNQGKCDFVFLTQHDKLLLIETKFISDDPGDTKRTRRTKQRKQVMNQVQTLKTQFCQHWDLAADRIDGAIFTTDSSLEERSRKEGIDAMFISVSDLKEWQQRQRDEQS